ILGLALTALGVGSGRGWAVPRIATRALLVYFIDGLCGMVLGAAIGLIGALIRRTRAGARLATWCAAANRPIHLFPRRRSPIARVDTTPPAPLSTAMAVAGRRRRAGRAGERLRDGCLPGPAGRPPAGRPR